LNEGRPADDVFKLLNLDKEGDRLFTSPMWNTWANYVARLEKGDPDKAIYSVLKANFGKENLKIIIDKAKGNVRTKMTADNLQEEAWLSEGKTDDDIFKLLGLDRKGAEFFESPMLSAWTSYVTGLEKIKEKSDEFLVITYLENRFGDKLNLARILSTEKHRHLEPTHAVVSGLHD
ncbi:hypothetical protein PHMEG_00032906, partial [Phytophthora megakarya]